MKGRIAWVFWLVVVLAVLSSFSSYAWLAMNLSAGVRGIELELESDSIFLEISKDPAEGYDKEVFFDRVMYSAVDTPEHELMLITYGRLPESGGLRITPTLIKSDNAYLFTGGKYDGTGRYYKSVNSDMSKDPITCYSYVDVTDDLKIGQSLVGLYHIQEGFAHKVSNTASYDYYYKHVRDDGVIDYVSIGRIPVGENLSNRIYWGYAFSDEYDDPQPKNMLNVVSLDTPPKDYSLKNTVYLRGALGTDDAKDLSVSAVKVSGFKNYLTDSIRIMFVATSSNGDTATVFYNHRSHSSAEGFDGLLFSEIKGNTSEVVTVDIYIYFDGQDPGAYLQEGFLTRNDISVEFSVSDHIYN